MRVQANGTVHVPWMSGANLEKDEKHFIDYIAYEGFLANDGKGRAASTIRGKVAAIRFMHTCNYYPGPVAGNPRIKATFKALASRRENLLKLSCPQPRRW